MFDLQGHGFYLSSYVLYNYLIGEHWSILLWLGSQEVADVKQCLHLIAISWRWRISIFCYYCSFAVWFCQNLEGQDWLALIASPFCVCYGTDWFYAFTSMTSVVFLISSSHVGELSKKTLQHVYCFGSFEFQFLPVATSGCSRVTETLSAAITAWRWSLGIRPHPTQVMYLHALYASSCLVWEGCVVFLKAWDGQLCSFDWSKLVSDISSMLTLRR